MRTLSIKSGVHLLGLSPQILFAITVIDGCYRRLGVDCVVTSATDSKHGHQSLHYVGHAIDIRTRDLDESQKTVMLNLVTAALGSGEFDVILERDHLHVEWQPKGIT